MSSTAPIEGCPVFPDFDPLVPDQEADAFPILARARREQPVFYMPHLDMWCVTRHEDIRAILRDPDTFGNRGANQVRSEPPPGIVVPPNCPFPTIADQLANLDPPRHDRIRKLIQPTFSPKRVGGREGAMHEIADELIDGFIDAGATDLVPSYSNLIPIRVIADILGQPPDAAAKFRRWTDALFQAIATTDQPEDVARRLWTDLLEFEAYVRAAIEEKRANPGDDLVSALISAESEDGAVRLTDEEILGNVIGFVVAGTDTTSILISHVVFLLLEDRERWQAVLADRSLVPSAVEETLRFLPPVRGLLRVVRRDTEVGGVQIPEGARIYWVIASANRDEEAFEDPDTFDVRRNNPHHLGLSALKHFCVGAPLARLETQVAIERLLDRIPDMRLDQPGLEHVPNFVSPSPTGLRVSWG
jgi:cytochrome P450